MHYIFLHGMGQTASSWDKTLSCLPTAIEASVPELSSFLTAEDSSYSNMYASFCKYCSGFSEPFSLCGLSLGAVLALNYAIDFPKRVKSLILVAPQYKMPKLLLKVQNVLFQFMPESQFADIGFQKKDFISLTNSMADLDFTKNLDGVTCPVLVLCGEKDSANKRAARALTGALPNACCKTINRSGHEVNVENPKDLARAITETCQETRNRPAH